MWWTFFGLKKKQPKNTCSKHGWKKTQTKTGLFGIHLSWVRAMKHIVSNGKLLTAWLLGVKGWRFPVLCVWFVQHQNFNHGSFVTPKIDIILKHKTGGYRVGVFSTLWSMLFQKAKINNYVKPPPSCQCFFISNMPHKTTKGRQFKTNSWWFTTFFHTNKKKTSAESALLRSVRSTTSRECWRETTLVQSRKKNCWVSHLCFSSLQLDLQLIYLSGVAPWIPRIPGFTTRLWWMKSAAGWEVLGIL